jgi:hypothetical protein
LSRTLNLLPYGDLINEIVYLHNSEISPDKCFAFALRTNPDVGFQELSLDRFVAALPRDDGE